MRAKQAAAALIEEFAAEVNDDDDSEVREHTHQCTSLSSSSTPAGSTPSPPLHIHTCGLKHTCHTTSLVIVAGGYHHTVESEDAGSSGAVRRTGTYMRSRVVHLLMFCLFVF